MVIHHGIVLLTVDHPFGEHLRECLKRYIVHNETSGFGHVLSHQPFEYLFGDVTRFAQSVLGDNRARDSFIANGIEDVRYVIDDEVMTNRLLDEDIVHIRITVSYRIDRAVAADNESD